MKTSRIMGSIMALLLMASITSCVKDSFDETVIDPDGEENPETPTPIEELEITQLQIPEDFEFATDKTVNLTINDNASNVKYDVYAYQESRLTSNQITYLNEEEEEVTETEIAVDNLNHLIFSGAPSSGGIQHSFVVPNYFEKLYIRRKEGFVYSSAVVDINDGNIIYTHNPNSGRGSKAGRSIVQDYLYCVNGSGDLFQVDPVDGAYTFISDMPMGSYTAAIDQQNKVLYSIGRSKPNPLMKYDIVNDSWTTVSNLNKGGPRLDYNDQDGLLYFSTGAKLFTIDPINGTFLSEWDINGLDKTNGGDLAFAEDGTLFLCTFSGLYRLELNNEGDYDSTRISGEDLPFNPTSMTFDSNNELWLANSTGDGDLIVMDTQTGGWQYSYGPNSNTNVTFGRTINDLTTFRIIDENAVDPDTDGDGITDSNDDFPEDADKAFEQFTPSKYGWGTVAFEDLWPFLGDYDFNDTAVNYRFVAVLNSQNQAVQLDIHYEVTSDGANFTNGFGIEFENMDPSLVASVTGTVLTENYITEAANGLEAGQDNAVVILFDNNETRLNIASTVSITFVNPIATSTLGTAPFNPFLIINKEREKEIHLPNKSRTTLGADASSAEGANQDVDGNYRTDSGLPWAINIVHNFKPPKERVPVNQAYNFFNVWASSGGSSYPDWYKDSNGYRNESNLKE
ncbi:MAG: LruC domain-containing protein [Bacteroidota bacterium]